MVATLRCPLCAAVETHVDAARVIRGPDRYTTRVEVLGRCENWHEFAIAYDTMRGCTSVSVRAWQAVPAEMDHNETSRRK